MAFQIWSVPVFVALACVAFAATLALSRGATRGPRTALLIGGGVLLGLLSVFAWWVNQGEPNFWGEQLFLASLGILAIVTLILTALAALLARRERRRRSIHA